MDRSLWLLLGLRTNAWVRRWARGLRSLKGLLLAVVGSLFFVSIFLPMQFLGRFQTAWQTDVIRHYGPFALLVYCLVQVLLSAGDRAVYYSPGEVNFLFCGPYRPRQLLLYKVVGGVGAGLLMTPVFTLAFSNHAPSYLSAAVGLFLAVELLYLFSIALGLVISTVGALAFNRARKALLYGLGALSVAALTPLGARVRDQGLGVWVDRLIETRVAAVVLIPFRPFVSAFTAERVWPDLVVASALAVLVNVVLVGLVLVLNAQFLESSAAASARIYARIQRVRRGDALPSGPAAARFSLPTFPWMWGIGPNAWRQLVTATRSAPKLVGVLMMFTFPVLSLLLSENRGLDGPGLAAPALSVVVSVSLFAPALVGFDFRLDYSRMEDLKTLPIPAGQLALGQLVAPVLILTAIEWVVFTVISYLAPGYPGLFLSAGALALPLNLMLLAVENLYFLWFPFRMTGFNAFDFQAMGRQMLLMGAKLFTVGVAAALATGAGAVAYFATGDRWVAAVVVAWLVVASLGLAMVPLLGHAFLEFDVSGSQPE